MGKGLTINLMEKIWLEMGIVRCNTIALGQLKLTFVNIE